jgi:hypothetical protein
MHLMCHPPLLPELPRGFQNKGEILLQGVGQELVHLGHLGGNAEVDRSVTNLDDQSANDVGVDLGGEICE